MCKPEPLPAIKVVGLPLLGRYRLNKRYGTEPLWPSPSRKNDCELNAQDANFTENIKNQSLLLTSRPNICPINCSGDPAVNDCSATDENNKTFATVNCISTPVKLSHA